MQINLWAITPDISETQKWAFIRRYRNELLARCDWTMVGDSPLSDEQQVAWMDYRQALRDIPNQGGDPDSVIFPSEP